MFVKELAKRLSSWVCDTLYHCVQCHLGSTDRSHAVMYPPRAEAPLDDLRRVSRCSKEMAKSFGPRILCPSQEPGFPKARGHCRR